MVFFLVLCRFKNVEDGFLWNFPKVYGSVLSSLREDFWDELGATRVLLGGGGGGGGGGGDFNVVRTLGDTTKNHQITDHFFKSVNSIFFVGKPITDHLPTNNFRLFSDHLPIERIWSVNGLQMVGNYRPN